jgi:hypothetical protein
MNELFEKYRKRLQKEGVIKAFLFALVAAFTVLAICSLVFWFVDFKAYWLGFIVFAVVLAAATPIFYKLFFRPNDTAIAKRLDESFSLEERMLTMTEFAGSNSFMANKQRADSVNALSRVSSKTLALTISSVVLTVGLAIGAVVGLGLSTVSVLTAYDVIPSCADLIAQSRVVAPKVFTITYQIEGSGILLGVEEVDGVISQQVTEGEKALAVYALPVAGAETDWYFAGWSDGVGNPYRVDTAVTSNLKLTAKFAAVDGEDSKVEEDASTNTPTFMGSGSGDSDPNDPNSTEQPPQDANASDSEDGDNSGASGAYQAANQVIDNETYYGGSTYENAYEEAMSQLSESDDIPDDVKEFIKKYYEIIKK